MDAGKPLQIGLSYTVVIRIVPCARRWYVRRSLELQRSKRTGVERQIELTAETLWNEVASRLKGALNETTYRTWFAEAEGLELTDDTFSIAVPNDFTREWIEGHFVGLIKAAVRDATGVERRISLTISDLTAEPAAKTAEPPKRAEGELANINPKYTFDLFVIGSSNRFAHAAALAVAEAPAQAYNPLFIYGGTGLGKTHLMQAVAQYVAEHSGDLSVKYVTSETFMNDFINSLRDKRIEGFKQRYRTYDLLLVDDVQFFEHKERIQEEFFHTFNSLYEAGSQIVMSSDRPPRDIATLEERLRSRFEWGLITDIQPPDLETRIAILRKKVKTDGIHVSDPQVLTFIASRVSTNIRELEGALTRVVAFSSLTGRAMSVDLAQDVLKDVFPQGEAAAVSIKRIQDLVAERFNLSLEELCGDKRSQNIVYPRQVAMYLSRELTDSSLPKIGKEFGGRDHTTVIHATSKIARLIREDRSVYNLVQELTARVKQVR
ncbi:MAG: chromosomal replication initiator protein [Gaiellaceae bacterium]|nr:chromosomal replication initiator protein [Gaiellaceae bacterium]